LLTEQSSEGIPIIGIVVETKQQMLKKPSNIKNKKWLLSLLFVFALSLVGWGIKVLIGSFMPLWLLLGFSVTYSIEKWLSYYTMKHRIVGRIYRLVLNLSLLSLLGGPM